ncbi:hypothetical protein PP175_28990 (plasmid) [Aneurinibacillus sp. Ricciae_BoGa-3]|uniref:hypothetical protein n=1 Tax=Aneurinibacillus sp. Ricciae_BoGa-3 TaxID=3022697 RepID=UPI002341D2E5|nr:hypothetical protein [Aneurinibacillus sp. Ricciae_BoGa-3]WCK57228.1 hypothetical protein PP175_28990 [Aneurinibacillus sp. Ricciae_BoGa-3]
MKDKTFRHRKTGRVITALGQGLEEYRRYVQEHRCNGDMSPDEFLFLLTREDFIEVGLEEPENNEEYEELNVEHLYAKDTGFFPVTQNQSYR